MEKFKNIIGLFQLKVRKSAKFEVKIWLFELKMLKLVKFEVLDFFSEKCEKEVKFDFLILLAKIMKKSKKKLFGSYS